MADEKTGEDISDIDIIATNRLSDEPPAEVEEEAAASAPPEEGADDAEAEKAKADGEDAAGDEAEGKPKGKAKPKVQERIDELTKARREAERRAEAAERELSKFRQAPAADLAAPDPASYANGAADPNYIADLALHKAEKRREQQDDEARKAADKERASQREQAWRLKVSEAALRHEDFNSVALNQNLPVTDAMAGAIQESEIGPDVLYHLGQNPDEAIRIASLSATRQAVEIGRIETLLEDSSDPPPKKLTTAPIPAKRLTGKMTPSKAPERMSNEEYRAMRRKQTEAAR